MLISECRPYNVDINVSRAWRHAGKHAHSHDRSSWLSVGRPRESQKFLTRSANLPSLCCALSTTQFATAVFTLFWLKRPLREIPRTWNQYRLFHFRWSRSGASLLHMTGRAAVSAPRQEQQEEFPSKGKTLPGWLLRMQQPRQTTVSVLLPGRRNTEPYTRASAW